VGKGGRGREGRGEGMRGLPSIGESGSGRRGGKGKEWILGWGVQALLFSTLSTELGRAHL